MLIRPDRALVLPYTLSAACIRKVWLKWGVICCGWIWRVHLSTESWFSWEDSGHQGPVGRRKSYPPRGKRREAWIKEQGSEIGEERLEPGGGREEGRLGSALWIPRGRLSTFLHLPWSRWHRPESGESRSVPLHTPLSSSLLPQNGICYSSTNRPHVLLFLAHAVPSFLSLHLTSALWFFVSQLPLDMGVFQL